MKYKVISKEFVSAIRASNDTKVRYELRDDNGVGYYALSWEGLQGHPLVYDKNLGPVFNSQSWSLSGTQYAYNNVKELMHRLVAHLANIQGHGDTVDHINGFKLDNRSKNLRFATQSQQNSNRPSRSDKTAPCDELQGLGINELPKFVRWDRCEEKFIIEKHPHLITEVSQGIRKRAVMSGSKSRNIGVIEKYKDILARLESLDIMVNGGNPDEFAKLKKENTEEYISIQNAIKEYNHGPESPTEEPAITNIRDVPNIPDNTANSESTPALAPLRRTTEGKKTTSKLPEDCGVVHKDIPKFCYYKAKTATRGDFFVIDKHPTLITQGKRLWATTSMSGLSTRAKFDLLLEKYAELNSAAAASMSTS